MTDERCKQILYDLRFVVENEYYSDDVEEALDRAIEAIDENARLKVQKISDNVMRRLLPEEVHGISAEAMRNKFKEMINGGAEDGEDSSID